MDLILPRLLVSYTFIYYDRTKKFECERLIYKFIIMDGYTDIYYLMYPIFGYFIYVQILQQHNY